MTQAASPSTLVSSAISHIHIPDGEGPWNQQPAMADLELLHNYTTSAIPSLFPQPEAVKIFTDDYVRIGLSRPYVLDALLAVSALHLYSKDRSRKDLFTRASALQSAALQLAQPHIVKLSLEHCIGVFIFSSFTAIFALAEVMLNPHDGARDMVEETTNCFQLARGIKTVVAPFWPHIRDSFLAPLFMYSDNRADLLPYLEQEYPTLRSLKAIALHQSTEERRHACTHAIDVLFLYIAILRSNSEDHPCSKLILSWMVEVQTPYMEMLSERNPFALVILAHYAVLMKTRPRAWHIVGWPAELLNYIEGHLETNWDGEEWTDLLRWPQAQIGGTKVSTPATVSSMQ